MKRSNKGILLLVCVLSFMFLAVCSPSVSTAVEAGKKTKTAKTTKTASVDPINLWQAKPNAAYDASKMGDWADFDPSTVVSPTGDTIRIAVVASFSGPSALNGALYWLNTQWVAWDINRRGGIYVDGKKKLIEIIKADHMGKADQCKKICERMILQEKVNALWGTDASSMMRIINEVANKYKVIAVNAMCLADSLMDGTNFSRYAFQATYSTEQVGRAFAYYYSQRKKEKKFYILCQDYSFGHEIAEGFKKGLKEYYPEGEVVGEDYHKLFLTDFAPYIEKIKAAGAEAIFTGNWDPDAGNVLKQSRQMNVMLPYANIYMDSPTNAHEVGVEGTKGLTTLGTFLIANPQFKTPGYIKMAKAWNTQWNNKWKTAPYNSRGFEHYTGNYGAWTGSLYWFLSVMERAKTTDPEKIIQLWENDTYQLVNGKVWRMRACDHKLIEDLSITEFVPWEEQKVAVNVPPYYWFKGCSFYGPVTMIPAAKVLPWMDQKLDRCTGKNGWGE
jgi:branched-chain amino acid transport system substrate-binding protein